MPEIQTIYITTRPGNGSEGAAERGWYFIEDGVLTMCDEDGFPSGRTHKLRPNDNPTAIAQSFRYEAWLASDAAKPFNRPLKYAPLGLA
jgi:hypothetical protein